MRSGQVATADEIAGTEDFYARAEGLPRAVVHATALLPLIKLVSAIAVRPDAAREFADRLKGLTTVERESFVRRAAAVRLGVGVSAAALYSEALADANIAHDHTVRELMLRELVDEADATGEELLVTLRAAAPRKLREPFRKALVSLRSEARHSGMAPRAVEADFEAWVSNPDGKGAVAMFIAKRQLDGSHRVFNACVLLTGGVCNGFFDAATTREELDEIFARLNRSGLIELSRAPASEVAALFDEALRRTEDVPRGVDASLDQAIELASRVPPCAPHEVAPGREVSRARLEALLDRRLHYTWFFDQDDLRGYCGIVPGAYASAADIDATLRMLADSPVRERVIAMARYMSRWAAWRGDEGEAADWTTLADEAERDFVSAPLAVVMLDAFHRPRGSGRTPLTTSFAAGERAVTGVSPKPKSPTAAQGDRAPTPAKAPCPCGSGKRFRRCCGR